MLGPIHESEDHPQDDLTTEGKTTSAVEDYTSNILFDALYKHDSAIDPLIREWHDSYETDQVDAIVELVNFLVQSTGCPGSIDRSVFDEEQDIAEVLGSLQERFNTQKQNDYPVIAKGKANIKFRKNFLEFWKKWTISLKSGLLYEEDSWCIEAIKGWMVGMSSSAFRPFRHTSTAICLTMLSALCDVTNTVHQEWTTANLQLNAEKKKTTTSKKISQLNATIHDLKERKDVLEAQMEDIFEGVFVHRYRDSDAMIRTECIKELGTWIVKFPVLYLDPSYLRYIGWMLSDKVASVRQESLKVLIRLYRIESMVPGLRELTERFKKRVLEMAAKEKDPHVQITAVSLVSLIGDAGLFLEEDSEQLLPLLCVEQPKIRNAIAHFAIEVFQEQYESPSLENLEIPRNRKSVNIEELQLEAKFNAFSDFISRVLQLTFEQERELEVQIEGEQPEMPQLTQEESEDQDKSRIQRSSLVRFLLSSNQKPLGVDLQWLSEVRLHAAVEALSSHLHLLNEVSFLGNYLTKDRSSKQKTMDSETETILLCCFASLVWTHQNHLMLDKKVGRLEEDVTSLSPQLVDLVPKFLTKYAADYASEVGPFRLLQCFKILKAIDLQVYQDMRIENQLESLIESVLGIFERLIDVYSVDECAKALVYLVTGTTSNAASTDLSCRNALKLKQFIFELFISIDSELGSLSDELKQNSKKTLDIHETSVLLSRIQRLRILLSHFPDFSVDLSSENSLYGFGSNVIEYSLALLKDNTEDDHDRLESGQLLIQEALGILLEHLVLSLKNLFEHAYPDGFPDIEDISEFRPVEIESLDAKFQENFQVFKDQITQYLEICEALLVADLSENPSDVLGLRLVVIEVLADIYLLLNGDSSIMFPEIAIHVGADVQSFLIETLNQVTELLFLNGEPSKDHQEAQLVLKHKNLSLFGDVTKMMLNGLLASKHVPGILKYFGLKQERSVFGFTLENLLNKIIDFSLPSPLAQLLADDGDDVKKLNSFKTWSEQSFSTIFESLNKSIDLFCSARVNNVDAASELAIALVSVMKDWSSTMLSHPDNKTLQESFTSIVVEMIKSAIQGTARLMLVWKRGSRSRQNDMAEHVADMTFDTEDLSLFLSNQTWSEQHDAPLVASLEQMNQVWKVWGIVGAGVHYICNLFEMTGKVNEIIESIEDAILLLSSKGVKPTEEEQEWNEFWQFKKAIENGDVGKKATTKERASATEKKARTRRKPTATTPKVSNKQKTSKSNRKSLTFKSSVADGEDDTERNALRRSGRNKANQDYAEKSESEIEEDGIEEEDQDEAEEEEQDALKLTKSDSRTSSKRSLDEDEEEEENEDEIEQFQSSSDLISRKKIRI